MAMIFSRSSAGSPFHPSSPNPTDEEGSPSSSPPFPRRPTFPSSGKRGPPAPTRCRMPAKGKGKARCDAYEEPIDVSDDDDTDPSNSDSHGLINDLPAKLSDLLRHFGERCTQMLDEAMAEIKDSFQATQEGILALLAKHNEKCGLVFSSLTEGMQALAAEHGEKCYSAVMDQAVQANPDRSNARLHGAIEGVDTDDMLAATMRRTASHGEGAKTTRKRSKLSHEASAANRSQTPIDLRGPNKLANAARGHTEQQNPAADRANPLSVSRTAPIAHHHLLKSPAQATSAVHTNHRGLDQGDGATLDQNNNGAQDKYQGQSERCETQMTKEAGNHLRPSCMSSVWFKHDKPTPIEISAKEIKMQVIRGGILHADLCSALIRLYQQLDAKMNTNPCGQWWRHFFLPQFAKALMFEPNFSSMKAVSDMFDQHINGYKIQNCQLLISPVQLASDTWACYIWDMEKRQMHILDPVLQHREVSDVSAKHRQTVTMIHTGLLTCINKFFDDWDINPDGWTCTYHTKISPRCQKWNSVFHTLYYAREFYDGKLSNVLDSGRVAALRRDLFYKLLTMEGNSVSCQVTLRDTWRCGDRMI
uniref:Ubiquitin-like protease family profile domain-containing protein n=1 Tax=Oryza barthii TaxID=65489 RepID=A0A0D3GAS4_9ORYZ